MDNKLPQLDNFEDITKRIEESFEDLYNLDEDEKKKKLSDVKEMIKYFTDATHDIESRRIKLGENSWQTIIIILGVITLIFSSDLLDMYKILFSVLIGVYLIPQILKIREYLKQNDCSYPFLQIQKYSNQWKWFYYGNKYLTNIPPNPCSKEVEESKKNYLLGLKLFLDNYLSENLESELKSGLLQLYLLQVHNYYKNRWYKRLLGIDKKWSKLNYWIILLLVIVLFIIIRLIFPALFTPEFFITG